MQSSKTINTKSGYNHNQEDKVMMLSLERRQGGQEIGSVTYISRISQQFPLQISSINLAQKIFKPEVYTITRSEFFLY